MRSLILFSYKFVQELLISVQNDITCYPDVKNLMKTRLFFTYMLSVLVFTSCGGEDSSADGGSNNISVEGKTYTINTALSRDSELHGQPVTIYPLTGMEGNDLNTMITSSVFFFKDEGFAAASVSIGTRNPRIYSFACQEDSDEIYKVETPIFLLQAGEFPFKKHLRPV
jgi:hypothetical protein